MPNEATLTALPPLNPMVPGVRALPSYCWSVLP